MSILKKIVILVLAPIFINATIQRVPGQPSDKPIKHKKEENPKSSNEVSQYIVTVQKINGKSPKYNIKNYSDDSSSQNYDQDSEEPIERIGFGDWRD